jgi:hypothetical protein
MGLVINDKVEENERNRSRPNWRYSSAPVSAVNTFLNLPRVCETADNTERYR